MSAIERFLLTYSNDKDKASRIAQDTAKALETNHTTLIEVVQSLGEYINQEDATKRAGAVQYLSHIMGCLPPNFLSRQQVRLLCQFLCDRIEDGGALQGLKNLETMGRYNQEMAILTFRAILAHFQDLQARPQLQRLQILDIISTLMSKHRGTLRDLGSESIVGITDLVSGEKDPRNLMVVFSILKVIMVEWDISEYAEKLFDSVFCYFPITFRPPPNDPYGITAQDLKDRLRECISASGYFAPYAFPQLLDKLDSTSPSVKKDVLQAIAACASSYSQTAVSNYSVTIWDSLKFEILNVQEEGLAVEALKALQAIAIRLGRGLESTDPKTPLANYLRPILDECNQQLEEPQHKQAKPAGQILSALGVASPIAFFLIIKAVLPPLLTLYQGADSIAKQRALLEVLVQLLDSAIAIYGSPTMPAPETSIANPLVPFKDRLFELNSQALMSTAAEEVSFRVVALRALLRLCLLGKYLEENEIGMVVQYLDEIVLCSDPTGRDDLRKEAIGALVEISRAKPNLVMDITFPAFMARLPDSCPTDRREYLITLEGLAQLSVDKFVSDTLIRRLLNRLDVVLGNDGSSAYPQAILSTLQYVLAQRDLQLDPELQGYFESIVVGLITRTVLAAAGGTPTTALNDESTMEILARLTTMIVRNLDEHKQKSLALQCYSLFVQETLFSPVPFRQHTPRTERATMILSTAVIAGVVRTAALQFTDAEDGSTQNLLAELVRLALAEDFAPIRQTILRQIGLIINKFMPPQEMHYATDILSHIIGSLTGNITVSENAIRIVFWMSKAMLLRLTNTEEVLKRLLSLLSDSACGSPSARGFNLLLAPDETLTKENGATIRLLAKQKVFNVCVPTIAAEFRNVNTSIKPNYLIALSGILKYMQPAVVLQEIDVLLPLLLQSLDLENPDVKAATIQTLMVITQESPKAVEGHISSLVTRLLNAASNRIINPPEVRLNALKCLRIFPRRIKDSNLLPHKTAVTSSLMTVLDDPKRIVRKEAVECRAAWFNMDEPQSE
ncbi:MAG: hypothetical protein Q9163_003205 [Psora crenata]